MDRRRFVGGIAGAVLVKTNPAEAQSPAKVPRIGVLFTGTPATAAQVSEAFNQGLRERGYVEGKNFVAERRYGDANPERLSELAADLVRLKVDVIVTSVDEAIAAIKALPTGGGAPPHLWTRFSRGPSRENYRSSNLPSSS
jgi:putative tryptophan/tyrosine transport system substrate-binding protein